MPGQAPFQFASRGPASGFLESLVGREFAPSIPQGNQQVPTSELIRSMNEARGFDQTRLEEIRKFLEQRSNNIGPQGPLTSADESTSGRSINPFKILEDALSDPNSIGQLRQSTR